MILRTSIYNHNYYPIKLYNLSQQILLPDNETVHNNFSIHDTTFDNDLGLLIKPFQDVEYLTIIEPNSELTKFDGDIVFEQIIKTDSYDYSAFGNLSKQHYNLNKRPVIVKLDDYSRIVFPASETDIPSYDENEFLDIEFNMKGIDDQNKIYTYLKTFNLHNFEIEDVSFYGSGINAIEILEKTPEVCTLYGIKRAMTCPELFTTDIITLCESNNGTYKVQIDKENEDVQVKLRMKGSIFSHIIPKITEHWLALMAEAPPAYMPTYQFPIGMSVVLNLTPKNKSPYKLNLKIYTNVTFCCDSKSATPEEEEFIPYEVKEFLKILYNPSFNRNTIMPSPGSMKIYSHPSDFYSGQVQVFVYPFKNFAIENSQTETQFVITDVTQKIEDENTTNGNVSIATDAMPSIKVVPQNETYLDRNPFNIFVDTTNLIADYENALVISFTYNGVAGTREVPVNIYTNVELKSKLSFGDIFQSDSGEYPCGLKAGSPIPIPKLNTNIGHTEQDEILTIFLNNKGNANAKIDSVELIDIDNYKTIFKDDQEALNNISTYYINGLNEDTLRMLYAVIPENEFDVNKNYNPIDYYDKGKISDYISYKIDSIQNENLNLNNLQPIIIKLKLKRLKPTQNQVIGKGFLLKINFDNTKYIYTYTSIQSVKLLNTQTTIIYEKYQYVTYLRPRVRSTIFLKLFKSTSSFFKGRDFGDTAAITDVKILNYNDNIETLITDEEFLIDKSSIPFSLLSNKQTSLFSFDLDLREERLYQFKLRLYTNVPNIPFIDVPYEMICTSLDAEQAIRFDSNDFYVRNNKYFLSLNRNVPKKRNIKIQNISNVDLIVNSIKFDLPTAQLGMTELSTEQLNTIKLPYKFTSKNPINLQFEFQGRAYGRSTGFIILDTDLGQVYLPVVIFVNTKLKDVMVLMENRRGVEFTSPLNSVDKEFIKLTNFGNDLSLIDVLKLGYDKNEFLVENNVILFPNTVNYMETLFLPTSTGKKIGYVDIKIKDMLETYVLRDTDQSKSYKIQNTHIIAELMGNALSDHALPQFSKSVVDFGFLSVDKKDRTMRYDTFKIKNLGLTPFIITSISKADYDSPFMVPLGGNSLPIKVDTQIELPVQLNNKKLNDSQKIYTDLLKFEMQDLKSKRMFTYDIIMKIELTDQKREYFSFNSEYIQFGYCQINHFKTDEITVKNYSTDKVVLNIDTTGDNELQSVENMTLNLQPSQSFDIPLYFYPHGIAEFRSKLVLNFDEGNYIKEIELFGLGVDFNSPLIRVENKLAEYYKNLVDHLGRPKYI